MLVERVIGPAIADHLPALAALRIRVFREYPYLYDGDEAYERRYLASYATTPDGLVVLARDGERVVGAATALPLAHHSDDVVPPLVAAGYAPERVYYFGESVLDAAYRGRGLGRAFLDEREAHARERAYAIAAFCAVERAPDDPRRPPGYRPLDGLWQRHGFAKRSDITATFSWREVGEPAESPKRMVFWIKELA